MINTYSLEQMSETGNLDANLILRQYNLDLMWRFKETTSINPRLTQEQITKDFFLILHYKDMDII